MNSSAGVWSAILMLAVVGLLGYGIVKLRRAREAHRTRSNERAAAMLLAMHQESAKVRADPVGPSAPVAIPSAGRPAANPVRATLQRKVRLLDDNQRLLYLVLRSGLADHVIMASMRLADLVDEAASPSYAERDTKMRLLLQERLDFVVCSNDLTPLAAVMIYAPSSGVPDERIKAETLRELGVRFLRFRSDSLPKPAEMRGLVLG